MVLVYKVFFILTLSFCLNLKGDKPDRLTFVQTYDPNYIHYVFNAEEEYVKHGFFEKNEEITLSGKYSYKWEKQDQNTYIKFINIST